tara:strand:+ start:2062 stop:2439 length:378 start_codon:yes stop_codon:yes gene_type:complete
MTNFVEQILQLCDDMLIVIPRDSDIIAAKAYIHGLKTINPKLLLSSWHEHVTLLYKDQIDDNNFDYFLKADYNSHLDKVDVSGQDVHAIIAKIRNNAMVFSEHTQQTLLKYVQNLCNLTMLYFEK